MKQYKSIITNEIISPKKTYSKCQGQAQTVKLPSLRSYPIFFNLNF